MSDWSLKEKPGGGIRFLYIRKSQEKKSKSNNELVPLTHLIHIQWINKHIKAQCSLI